ncbi:LPXTG cell wall anchor domain-containing protein [Streptococcus sp. CCH5-D3]|uniref:LPXTG cell wall anchor domain-containing protein n=1 Tax=Streptococcus sp. CCH5-D3 TaxID=1768764 RepID=UPI00076A60D5|nr:LPXTG cell wall anchor domain-containing protein [Streptococcus sp. CCH5-D3]
MKSFNTQTTSKPSYVKTKAYGLCGTLALATALLIGAGTVSADETAQPVVGAQPTAANVYTADNAGNVTVTPSETVAPVETPKALAPAPVESQPIAETPATTTEVAQPAETPAAPTTVTKTGDTINVENPNVEVTFPNGNGKYNPFEVEYKDIQIPDDVQVNEGDKVTLTLPKEVTFQTDYDFDVYNPNKEVIGHAATNLKAGNVVTTFNNYFQNNPLNKRMSLKLDASWTDKVVPGKPVNINFNGTVVTVNVGSEQVIGKDELIAKWGFQDKEDPTVINWTARVNYAKRALNYVTIIDEMSENQKLVDNYFEIKNIESVDPWVDKGSAMDLVKSISKSEHGFEIKMDRLDRMVYLYYKTKLVNAVKDSTNPTNKIELKAENDGAVSYQKIQLVGGKGDASGENKPEPTFEVPHDAPKYEKPEFKGGIPGIPEVRELPPFEGGVIPNDAPILDLPELEIPVEPEKPSTPKEVPSKPVEVPKEKVAQPATVSYNFAPTSKETPKTTVYGGTLPNTGEKEGIASTLGLVVIAAGITGLTLGFKKRNEEKGE